MALTFDMNVLDGSSLGLGFAIFDLAWEGDTFSFFHFCHYLHHIHDYAMKGVALMSMIFSFDSSKLLTCWSMPLPIIF
jgi:hypothetical protein